jgi:hypothetical protein
LGWLDKTYSQEIMNQFNLFIDSKWFLCEVRQEATINQRPKHTLDLTYLLRYLAIGSALFILKSFKKPEKLNVGSCSTTSSSCLSTPPCPAALGVDGPGPTPGPGAGVGGRSWISTGSLLAGVAKGSNSDKSILSKFKAWLADCGVDEEAGVWSGRSLGIGFGAGAEGVVVRIEAEAGAGVWSGNACLGGGLVEHDEDGEGEGEGDGDGDGGLLIVMASAGAGVAGIDVDFSFWVSFSVSSSKSPCSFSSFSSRESSAGLSICIVVFSLTKSAMM